MKQVNYHYQTQKRQVGVPTINPDQIKPKLGVKLTAQQKLCFIEVFSNGADISLFHPKVIASLVRKNLIRMTDDACSLTARGVAYLEIIENA